DFKLPGLRILGLSRGGEVVRDDLPERTLKKSDRLIIAATSSELLTLREKKSLRVGLAQVTAQPSEPVIVEAVVAPQQANIGRRIANLALGSRFGVRILGAHRHQHIPGRDLESALLRPADRLLLEGPASGVDAMSQQGVIVSVTRTAGRAFRRSKAPIT